MTGLLGQYYDLIRRPYYRKFHIGHLLLNWIVQRIFGINGDVPFSVHFTTRIQGIKGLIYEDDTVLVSFCASGGGYFTIFENTTLTIGSGTIWAYNVCIQTGNHDANDLTKYITSSVKIGRNCWLGNGSVVLAGVTLGDNVIVGANSVVTKSFPSGVVIAGAPAKVIREAGTVTS